MTFHRSIPAIVFGVLILIVAFELLRRRQVREKYAVLWLTVSVVTVLLAIFPEPLFHLSTALGFGLPSNLVFFVGGVLLLVISMQLSFETGRLEEESQRLAEEQALLRLEVARLREILEPGSTGPGGPAVRPDVEP